MHKKFIISLGLLLVSQVTHASIIEHYGYSRDSSSNVVSDGKLEWLSWNATKGMSIQSALTSFSADGWRLANSRQLTDLFGTFRFGLPKSSWDICENCSVISETAWSPEENSPIDHFVSLFGWTQLLQCYDAASKYCYSQNDPAKESWVMFGDDSNNDGWFRSAAVLGDHTFVISEDTANQYTERAMFLGDNVHKFKLTSRNNNVGVALVRDAPVVNPLPSVPTPGSLSILLAGLFILLFRNRSEKRVTQ